MKRSRPRKRNPYRDNVLTVPASPERLALEEERILAAWKRVEITLAPGQETRVTIRGVGHKIVNTTGRKIKFALDVDTDTQADN